MKKLLALALALAMVLSLTGCYRAKMLFADDVKTMEVEGWAVTKDGETPHKDALPDWGITLEAKDVTPTGMTLVIRQAGGAEVTGELNTGTPYTLKMRDGDTWLDLPLLREDIAWNAVAYLIPFGGELEQNLNWSQLYGELDSGEYLLVKSIMDFRAAGDYDTFMFSVEFEIE